MNDTPVFRSMNPKDEDAIGAMMKLLYESLNAPDDYMTVEKINATFQQVRKQSGYLQIDVFEMDNEIAGYALLFKYWYNEYGGMVLNIDELFVKRAFRDRGIASRYLAHLSEGIDDCVALSLEVLPSNEGAYFLYKRSGFAEKETITLYKILK